MPSLNVPGGFEYVIAVATSTLALNFWQAALVGRARKRAGIKYPQLYAEKSEAAVSKDAHMFNCTQRAHQNTLESTPLVNLGLLVSGLKYPFLAATLGGAYIVGRVLYTIGYTTGDPNKRFSYGGYLGFLSTLGLVLTTGYTSYSFIANGF